MMNFECDDNCMNTDALNFFSQKKNSNN